MATSRADRVVRQIESEIIAAGWPTGHPLGTERELGIRLGVSWPVIRQATRILALHGFVAVRHGAKGGLVVGAPVEQAVVEAVASVLEFTGANAEEIAEILGDLYVLAAELAAERVSARDVVALRRLSSVPGPPFDEVRAHDIREAVEAGTKNPVLAVLIAGLALAHARIAPLPPLSTRAQATLRELQRAVLVAISEGQPVDAAVRMRRTLQWIERQAKPGVTPWRRDDLRSESNLSAELAKEMARELRAQVNAPTEIVTSPTALQDRYAVSSTVLREACRILEHHGVAQMRKGPGGGLVASAPNFETVVLVLARYIERLNVDPAKLLESRRALELRCIELAGQRLPVGRAAVEAAYLADAPSFGQDGSVIGPDIHVLLAEVADNRALELFVRLMTHLTAQTPIDSADLAHAHMAHRAVLGALLDGDTTLARAHLKEHLEALGPWTWASAQHQYAYLSRSAPTVCSAPGS